MLLHYFNRDKDLSNLTATRLAGLRGLSYDEIAARLGFPLASQQGTTFEVVEITALRNGTSFTSVIAGTTEIGKNGQVWRQTGGDLQTLLIDRSVFSAPIPTGQTFP